MSKLKKGDLVKIRDGSYAVRVDKFEKFTHIGLCEDTFEVIKVQMSDHLVTIGTIPTKVHNIFIQNLQTGKVYLHSDSFVTLVVKCPCCGK